MKLAVFTVSMPDYEPIAALEKLAEVGYDGVEWRITGDDGDRDAPSFWSGNRTSMTADVLIERADEIKAACARLGLEMPSLGTYIGCEDEAVIERHMEAVVAVGAKALRVGSGRYQREGASYLDQMKVARERYAVVAELAEKHGVRACIETHMGLLTPSITKTMNVLRDLDPKHVGILWDPGNEVVEGSEVYQMAIEEAGDYLAEVHVKNMKHQPGEVERGQQLYSTAACPVMDGEVNWPEVIDVLKAKNYDGWLVTEDFSTETPLDDRLVRNHDWLRELIG